MHQMWRLSEAEPHNLGLACSDDGLLLGRTCLVERRDGRFVVRARGEIERLLKCVYDGDLPVDRLMSGLARVASALNANDQCLARIAAVHLQMPDLASAAIRDALAAEDMLIKYARDEGGGADWNPALHPRTGTPPNPGWFALTDGHGRSNEGQSRRHLAENQDNSHHSDATPIRNDEQAEPEPSHQIEEPPDFGLSNQSSGGNFWSNVRSAVRNWLEELVPEYELDSGRVVGQRPRWRVIAPYIGIPAATAAIFGGEAVGLPAVLSALGFGGNAVETAATSGAATDAGALISSIAQQQADLGVSGLSRYMTVDQLDAYLANPAAGSRFLGTAVHNATAKVLEMRYTGRFIYKLIGPDFFDTATEKFIELTTPRQVAAHLARPGYGGVTIATYTLR